MKIIIISLLMIFLISLVGCNKNDNINPIEESELSQSEGNINYDSQINNTKELRFSNTTFKYYAIIFHNFTIQGETDQQKRAWLFGFLAGINFYSWDNTMQNITVTIQNKTKVYTIDNFPIEDDCINESHCWIKFEKGIR